MKGKFIALFVLISSIFAATLSGCVLAEAKLKYALSEDGSYYSVVDCDALFETNVVIPSTYKDLPVKRIAQCAFSWCDMLTGITIPDSVTSIGESAFSFCCNLKNVEIGEQITTIEDSAFEGCDQLTSIVVDSQNKFYASVDGNLYSKSKEEILQYATGKTAESFVVPESVTTIGVSAFAWCESLKNVAMSNGIETIKKAAFYWCDGLKNIIVPDTVTIIGDYAFSWCENLESITIGKNVAKLGKEVLKTSDKLKTMTFQDVAAEWYCTPNPMYTGGEKVDVSNSTQNAANFLGENGDYYWYKK